MYLKYLYFNYINNLGINKSHESFASFQIENSSTFA